MHLREHPTMEVNQEGHTGEPYFYIKKEFISCLICQKLIISDKYRLRNHINGHNNMTIDDYYEKFMSQETPPDSKEAWMHGCKYQCFLCAIWVSG